MPPRRSHKKSRAGCRRCKARKIKCDEVHPRCGNCHKHGVVCDFEDPRIVDELDGAVAAGSSTKSASISADSPATVATPYAPATPFDFASPIQSHASPAVSAAATASASTPSVASATPVSSSSKVPMYRRMPTPAISATTPARHRMLELRLMHHYTSVTCKTITFQNPWTEDIWKTTVPAMAFSGAQHLSDSILAIAALHLRSQSPDDKDLIRASHAYMANALADYSTTLKKGINSSNAVPLFLTGSLIAFQATATRAFMKDEISPASALDALQPRAPYSIPFQWFHSFQGLKALTAMAWPYLRGNEAVTQIINSQAVLQLDFTGKKRGFFDHLLDSLEDELDEMYPGTSAGRSQETTPTSPSPPLSGGPPTSSAAQRAAEEGRRASQQAYRHAVAVLNWAHKLPHKGAALAFPATVAKRFVELLEEKRPRALATLACFFAQLKSIDGMWWLHGMAKREVLGIVSMFNSDYFGSKGFEQWWPHLEWALKIALYDDRSGYIPPHVWGADWVAEENELMHESFTTHIDMISRIVAVAEPLPAIPDEDQDRGPGMSQMEQEFMRRLEAGF